MKSVVDADVNVLVGRSLYRERGLKFSFVKSLTGSTVSLPLPGAWIEIVYPDGHTVTLNVAPFTGSVD